MQPIFAGVVSWVQLPLHKQKVSLADISGYGLSQRTKRCASVPDGFFFSVFALFFLDGQREARYGNAVAGIAGNLNVWCELGH